MITYGSTTLTSYNSIVKTEVYYYKSTSATSLSGGSWSTTKPTWENGKYIWQKIRTVYEDGTHSESDPVNITGQQGATGAAAYSYKLNSSDSIIGKTKDGEYTIKKITFSATYKQGTGAVSAYGGRFKIESTTNGSTWKTEYTSSGNEASKEFTIPDDIIAIKCSLYQSDGTTVLLDIVTVPVVKDGVDAIGLRDSIPYYLASDKDTGITRLTQGWTRYRPQLTAEKKYLWVYYVSRYSEGTTEPELIEIKDDLVHFVNNGDESPVESCVVDIDPVQAGSGDPSPDNIRPISGWTGCEVKHSGADMTNPTTYPITFPSSAGTVYGGYVDVINGELVVDRLMVKKSVSDFNKTSTSGRFFIDVAPNNSGTFVSFNDNLSNIAINPNTSILQVNQMYVQSGFRVQLQTAYTSKEDFVAAMGDNPFEFCGKLVTPIHYPLTPIGDIKTLLGQNNIWADTGQTSISYYNNQTSTDPYVDYSATSAFEYANTAINRATATYGTCSTDSTVDAKVVICPDFVLFNGARIQVTFTNANTASAPTLNVNSTGAKAIYINKTVTSSSNLLLWTAGSKMEFVYDGTGWIAQNVPYALYGTCSTGASTAAKTATCNEAVICKGTTISVNMTNTNTAANATLNVGSMVAKDIYANDTKLTVNSRFNWRANTVQKFVFDGQVWRMDDDSVKALATAYITEIDDDGIMVHPEDDSNSGWAISDAIQLFKNGISFIKLWIENNIPKIRIGKEDQGHIVLDNDSVDVRNGDDILASFGETSIIGDQNQWHQTIASDKTSFANGQTEYAYISPDKFYAVNAEVSDAFYIGNYSIRNAKDGKLIIGLRRR